MSALSFADPRALIALFGLLGVLAVIFAETGLLVGFFLPGDSLLFLAGVAASGAGQAAVGTTLPLPALLIGAPICAIAGAQLGHVLGARWGPRLFTRPNSRLFKQGHVDKAEYYFEKFGPAKAVVLARFIPIVRTFLNPVAGVLGMSARRFLLWNVVGGLLWTQTVVLLGYLLGDTLAANIDTYLLPVVGVIIVLSASPILVELLRSRRRRTRAPVAGSGLRRRPHGDGDAAGQQTMPIRHHRTSRNE